MMSWRGILSFLCFESFLTLSGRNLFAFESLSSFVGEVSAFESCRPLSERNPPLSHRWVMSSSVGEESAFESCRPLSERNPPLGPRNKLIGNLSAIL